mmetsp:Transcript_40137/g.126247  ORF Transcript_40137/g.126247 Transcript_40137/m.126247 type:complete len:115 (-) Transcript_40137:1792-2136(-)
MMTLWICVKRLRVTSFLTVQASLRYGSNVGAQQLTTSVACATRTCSRASVAAILLSASLFRAISSARLCSLQVLQVSHSKHGRGRRGELWEAFKQRTEEQDVESVDSRERAASR